MAQNRIIYLIKLKMNLFPNPFALAIIKATTTVITKR